MKKSISLIVLASFTMMLAGCSKHSPTASTRPVIPAIDLVQAGTNTIWAAGFTLHVAKREGQAIEGVQMISSHLDGRKDIYTADSGTVSPGNSKGDDPEHFIKIVIYGAKLTAVTTSGDTVSSNIYGTFILQRQM
jgi:hypothetical protein